MASILGLEVHEAASTGDYDTLEEFIKSGKYDLNLADEDYGNKTALHWACQKGYVECIRVLLENGAKPLTTLTGWTPAHFAAEAGKLSSLRALNAAGIRVDKKDNYGCTPKRVAEIYNHAECVKLLTQIEQEKEEQRFRAGSSLLSDDDDDDDSDVFTLPSTIEEKVPEISARSNPPSASSRRKGQNSHTSQRAH